MTDLTNEQILFNAVKELTKELKEQRKENKRLKSLSSIDIDEEFDNESNSGSSSPVSTSSTEFKLIPRPQLSEPIIFEVKIPQLPNALKAVIQDSPYMSTLFGKNNRFHFNFNNTSDQLIQTLPSKQFACGVCRISHVLYFLGDVTRCFKHDHDGYVFSKPPFESQNTYIKAVYNHKTMNKQGAALFLGKSVLGKKAEISFVDYYLPTTNIIRPFSSGISSNIVDIANYENGFLISFLNPKSHEYNLTYIDCSEQFGSKTILKFEDYAFYSMSKFLYINSEVYCFACHYDLQKDISELDNLRPQASTDARLTPSTTQTQFMLITTKRDKLKQSKRRDATSIACKTDFLPDPTTFHRKDTVTLFDCLASPTTPTSSKYDLSPFGNITISSSSSSGSDSPTNSEDGITSPPIIKGIHAVFIKYKDRKHIIVPIYNHNVISIYPTDNNYYALTDTSQIIRIHISRRTNKPSADIINLIPKEPYNKITIKKSNKAFKSLDGNNAMFLQTDKSLFYVAKHIGNDYYTRVIYTVPGEVKLVATKFEEFTISLYLTNYSVINMHIENFDTSTISYTTGTVSVNQ